MEDANIVAKDLVSLIQQTTLSTLAGVQLATLIRHKFPHFKPTDYNCRNLRHFIVQYAPQIQEVGRSGADIVYGLRSDQQQAATPLEPAIPLASFRSARRVDPFVWKAFTNPSSAYRVHANAETGELRSELACNAPSSPWVTVKPVTEEVHLEIARSFAAGLHDPQKRASLEGVICQPVWWTKIFATAMNLGLGVEWGAFRRRKLTEELEKALAALRIHERPGVRHREVVPPSFHPSPATAAESSLKGDEPLRRIISNVIKRLPSADLRALRLPVGDVLDAIKDE
jgi:hypothetical protein